MVDYAELEAELNAQWNAAGVVIVEPTYYNGNLRNTSLYPGVLFINIFPSTLNAIGPSGLADIVETSFLIKIVSASRANLEKYIQEIKRILHAKSVSGGHWRIISATKPTENSKRFEQTLTGKEMLFVANASWS